MSKVSIVYGSSTGRTEEAADLIQKAMGTADVYNIADTNLTSLLDSDLFIFGTSTWGTGEVQDDWADRMNELNSLDLKNKKVALFGLGDQESFSDTFADGLGILFEAVKAAQAIIIGLWPTDGYYFETSKALVNGKFVGLVLDDDNQASLTDDRIRRWTTELKKSL